MLGLAILPLAFIHPMRLQIARPFSYDLTSYWRSSPDSFKQLEQFTFYGFVIAIPKRVPILGPEIRVGYLEWGLGVGSDPRGMG